MKVYHTSLNKGHDVHGIWQWMFGSFYTATTLQDAEFIFIVLFNHPFELDVQEFDKIKSADKPIVVFDFWEIGWDNPATGLPFPELNALHDKVVAYFKRELAKDDEHGWHPIDFYNFQTWPTTDTYEQYCARPIDILMIYGLSNPIRPAIHGALIAGCHSNGWIHISNPRHMEHEKGPFAVLVHAPWYDRISEEEMYRLQSMAKITISLPGAGKKCFRSAEASLNSVMAMTYENIVWEADWKGGENCLELAPTMNMPAGNHWVRELRNALNKPEELYQIYLKGTRRAHQIKPDKTWQYILSRLNRQ